MTINTTIDWRKGGVAEQLATANAAIITLEDVKTDPATISDMQTNIATLQAADLVQANYTPGTGANWGPTGPVNYAAAIDRLAADLVLKSPTGPIA